MNFMSTRNTFKNIPLSVYYKLIETKNLDRNKTFVMGRVAEPVHFRPAPAAGSATLVICRHFLRPVGTHQMRTFFEEKLQKGRQLTPTKGFKDILHAKKKTTITHGLINRAGHAKILSRQCDHVIRPQSCL